MRSTVKALLLAVLMAAGILAAVPAAVAAAPSATVNPKDYLVSSEGLYRTWGFTSPAGDVRCIVTVGEDASPWGCQVLRHTWKDPKLPDAGGVSCAQDGQKRLKGSMLALAPGAGFYVTCGKSKLPKTLKALPENGRIKVQGITCTVVGVLEDGEGVACTGPKRSSLVMSTDYMTFTQPKGFTP